MSTAAAEVAARNPTNETYEHLDRAYDTFNRDLFGGKLPVCLISIRARGKHLAYFSPERFVDVDGVKAHEIALNPSMFAYRSIEQCLSSMVHEMCHLQQWIEKTESRRGYHNWDFAAKMEAVGLMTSTTGAPGGLRVGDAMSHYIIPDGPFARVVAELVDDEFKACWADRFVEEVVTEWVPGMPMRLDSGVKGREANQLMVAALAAGASRPVPAPLPGSYNEAKDQLLKGLERVASERSAPAILRNPDAFNVPRTIEGWSPTNTSKSKFVCVRCKQIAWGKQSLNINCGECGIKMELASLIGVLAPQPRKPAHQ